MKTLSKIFAAAVMLFAAGCTVTPATQATITRIARKVEVAATSISEVAEGESTRKWALKVKELVGAVGNGEVEPVKVLITEIKALRPELLEELKRKMKPDEALALIVVFDLALDELEIQLDGLQPITEPVSPPQ